jgi:hypothetical protein
MHDATARQNSGEPLSVIGQTGDGSNGPRSSKMDGIEAEIAGLPDRSTHELRLAWRKVYRREPPVGLSRDLMIRALANLMQEHAYCVLSPSVKHRLSARAGEFEKGSSSFIPRVVLKMGARLVRQWRGHAYTVLVLEGGFEYEGQRYGSLTDSEAETVRDIFQRYAELGSIRSLKEELEARGLTSKFWTSASGRLWGGKPFARGAPATPPSATLAGEPRNRACSPACCSMATAIE